MKRAYNLIGVLLAGNHNIFGPVQPPPGVQNFAPLEQGGLIQFLNIILKLLVAVAGIYALLNIIFAGYAFMSAGGDPKAIEKAWAKIWQSFLGLLLVAGSFLLAAIIGQLIFGSADAILNPEIQTPGGAPPGTDPADIKFFNR